MNPLVPTGLDVAFTTIAIIVGVALLVAVFAIATWLLSTDRVTFRASKRPHAGAIRSPRA